MNFYNEHDPHAAAWLRELIREGHIPPGTVDERDIQKLTEADLVGFTQVHLFAGIGGWSHALRLAGWPDDQPVWTGSCPCQPFSDAGEQKGEADARHLWPEMRRLLTVCHPSVVFGEQVASKLGRQWLARVRADLEELGYAVGAADLCAAGTSAPHIRQRLFWVADAASGRRGEFRGEVVAGSLRHADSGIETGRLAHSNGGKPWHGDVQPGGQHGQQQANGGVGGMANTELQRTGCGIAGVEGRAGSGRDRPAIEGATCGLDDSAGSRLASSRRGQSAESEGRECLSGVGCEVGGLGHSIGAGLEGYGGHGDDGDEPGRLGTLAAGSTATTGAIGYWDAFDLIPCRDEKVRRVEPGTFPLAHGIPGRVGALRGYGNAIVPPLAKTFIEAFLAARDDLQPQRPQQVIDLLGSQVVSPVDVCVDQRPGNLPLDLDGQAVARPAGSLERLDDGAANVGGIHLVHRPGVDGVHRGQANVVNLIPQHVKGGRKARVKAVGANGSEKGLAVAVDVIGEVAIGMESHADDLSNATGDEVGSRVSGRIVHAHTISDISDIMQGENQGNFYNPSLPRKAPVTT